MGSHTIVRVINIITKRYGEEQEEEQEPDICIETVKVV